MNLTDTGNQGFAVGEGRYKYGLKEDEEKPCSAGFESEVSIWLKKKKVFPGSVHNGGPIHNGKH